jgi:hypothetical protein
MSGRLDIYRCQTAWCRAPLARISRGRVVEWLVPVRHDPDVAVIIARCPACGSERAWLPARHRARGHTSHA